VGGRRRVGWPVELQRSVQASSVVSSSDAYAPTRAPIPWSVIYDDRRSRIPGVQDGVRVRGTVRDLLERSREEQIDLIVIALPLSAVSRISNILEQVESAVADICLTTAFVGFRYRSSQISAVGSNPVVLIDERPLKEWRAAKKSAFDIVVGSLMLVFLSPLLALIALAIRLDSPGPVLFRQPRLGFNNRLFTKQFVEGHGGRIEIESRQSVEDHGTTVRVFLPMSTTYDSSGRGVRAKD
jgi:hypothetical protein